MTAEKLFNKYKNYTPLTGGLYEYLVDDEDFKEALIEFAKYHVTKALGEAKIKYLSATEGYLPEIILNSYPLENIK